MNIKQQLTFAFFLSLLSAIAFSLIAILITEHKISQFDSSIISFIQEFESPFLTKVMKFFTFIGSGIVVIVLSVFVLFLLYKVLHHRSELLLFIAVVVGSAILNQVLKYLFHRPRPSIHQMIDVAGYSFPSGHSMEAFAFYGILAFLLWRHIGIRIGRWVLILISVLMILAIGISRIYLGVHYPSDVIGGYFASSFWLAAAIWFYQLYEEKRYEIIY